MVNQEGILAAPNGRELAITATKTRVITATGLFSQPVRVVGPGCPSKANSSKLKGNLRNNQLILCIPTHSLGAKKIFSGNSSSVIQLRGRFLRGKNQHMQNTLLVDHSTGHFATKGQRIQEGILIGRPSNNEHAFRFSQKCYPITDSLGLDGWRADNL